ncbi:hypothetical protein GOBAR_AA14975 [Gossypium barbadense]|uniref:Arabidopsis retrotransposon Orf1 C-terminal domain-containing protein n=1 Tax=Gossypium barbadense TaxID=3634 RepID=A0A2P5XQP6_GOSBA|nr:hypothetical protein GOBAR_AA14975 [Gossypium barbadense]
MKESLSLNQNRGKKLCLKKAHESFSSTSRGPIHEDRRLQIEELDEWRTHKPRTPDKLKLRQNEPDTSPNQLKVGDKVLLDASDPHIVTTTPNQEIPLTVLSSFPLGMVEVSHPKFGTFKERSVLFNGSSRRISSPLLQFPRRPQEELFQILWAQPLIAGRCIDWAAVEQVQLADSIRALLTTDLWELFFGISESTYLELTVELCSTFHLQTIMTYYDDPGTVQFRLGGLIHQLSVLEFGAALGLYTEEFNEENELHALNRHIHFSPSKCWHILAPSTASYNPSRSKASVLQPSLRYLHAILAHTITGRRESTGVVNTHNIYFLWYMSQGHVIDLAYFIALYRLAQSTEEEAYEDIPDEVPPQHEDPPTQPPPPSRPVHAVASYADISERLTRFEQQFFQRFDNIDATLQQICQHLHISSPVPPREPSSDEGV